MSKKRKNRKNHMGSSIDDFLKKEGIFEESQAQAIKEVVAWQLEEAMKKQKIAKNRMASMLKTIISSLVNAFSSLFSPQKVDFKSCGINKLRDRLSGSYNHPEGVAAANFHFSIFQV